MEPASIVGIIGSTASLIVLSGKLARDIHNLREKYANVPTKLEGLQDDCMVLEIGFRKVKSWLDRHRTADDDSLQACLDIFEAALRALDAEVSAATASVPVVATKFVVKCRLKMPRFCPRRLHHFIAYLRTRPHIVGPELHLRYARRHKLMFNHGAYSGLG